MADGFCMRKRIKASAILCSSQISVEDVNSLWRQRILRPSGTKRTPCPELSRPALVHTAPAADESGQSLDGQERRINFDPLVRRMRVAAARAEEHRRGVEVLMKDVHVARPADSSHLRRPAG